jgi:hypothetical protein
MTTAADVGIRIAARCRDTSTERTAAEYLAFLNDALADLRAAGWVLPLEEDETTSLSATTFSYTVPATFVYLQDVYMEGATAGVYDDGIARWKWRLGTDGGVAVIVFDSRRLTPTASKKLKVVGQKRPPVLATGDTVEPCLEAFLRERGVAYAAANLAEGESEFARTRQRISELAWQASELILSHQPTEYRMAPGSRVIPGR